MHALNSTAPTHRRSFETRHRVAASLTILSATLTILSASALIAPAAHASIGHAVVKEHSVSNNPDAELERTIERVGYADLDLTRVSESVLLKRRVRAAVRNVCRPAEVEAANAEWLGCLAKASTDSHRQIEWAVAVARANNAKRALRSQTGSTPGA